MYRVRILKAATRDLEKLDKSIARRIIDRINWLGESLESIKPESLSANLAGLHKLRVGDYRVIYEIIRDEQIILIHQVGHRREVYRRS
jgi:mRNA interferase RelE/StbE